MGNLKKLLLNSLLLLLVTAGTARAGQLSGGDFVITKDLLGSAGPQGGPTMQSADYSLAFAWGEPISGDEMTEPTYTVISGYFGGRFGNGQTFTLISSQVGESGAKIFRQGQLPVGVPFNAPVQMTFSDQLDTTTLNSGIQVVMASDHLGLESGATVPYLITTDPTHHSVTLQPQSAWLGNTLYDVQMLPALLSVDGFKLDQVYHVEFLTLLDHHQENVVRDPIVPAAASIGSIGPLSVDIPQDSLSDYSAVLFSRDPLTAPLHADPKIIQEANDKARAAGGAYRVPLSIQEINAYNANGNLMGPLSKPAQISVNYGGALASTASDESFVRPQTLSLWALDENHRLWVKLPASQNTAALRTVSVPVTSFSVFALMGGSDGSALDTYAFPVPWRPHGPNAGTGSSQTGTEADGITFSNLPSECTIKIYTLTGDLVRDIHHSDVAGSLAQEKWDVKTTHGESVASGVYLWRVESSVDGKNGKLMVIR